MRYFLIILLTILYLYLPAQQSTFLRATTAATSGGGSTTGILDSYTGAEAAYATALLYSSYGGSCLRVRRDSDNAEQDIGFSGQDIDEAAINSFCSGANCFVKTWYDQSGNGHNATQTTAGSQPKIYDSSTGIIYENSIVALSFNNSHIRSSSFSAINTPFTCFADYRFSSISTFPYIVELQTVNARTSMSIYNAGGGARLLINGNYSLYFGTVNTSTTYLMYSLFSSLPEVALNGASPVTGSVAITTTALDGVHFGSSYNLITGSFFVGKMRVAIIYPSDQSANKTGIETAINNYYNIYP